MLTPVNTRQYTYSAFLLVDLSFVYIGKVGESRCTYVLCRFSCVQFFATLWTVACQAPLSMEFSRQVIDSSTGMDHHVLLQGIFLTQGSKMSLSCLPHWQAGFWFLFFTTSATWEAYKYTNMHVCECVFLHISAVLYKITKDWE